MKNDASRSVTRIAVRGLAGGEADAKGVALHDLDVDVLPHPLDDVLHEVGLRAIGVQVEVLDDALQPRPAENLLADRLEPISIRVVTVELT